MAKFPRWCKAALQNSKGFTLIELIIVIAVVVLLAAITIPSYLNMLESAKEAEVASVTHDAYLAVMLHYTDYLMEKNSDPTASYTAESLAAEAAATINASASTLIEVTDHGDSTFTVTVTIGSYTAYCDDGGMSEVTKL